MVYEFGLWPLYFTNIPSILKLPLYSALLHGDRVTAKCLIWNEIRAVVGRYIMAWRTTIMHVIRTDLAASNFFCPFAFKGRISNRIVLVLWSLFIVLLWCATKWKLHLEVWCMLCSNKTPVGIWYKNDVISTSMRRHYVASTVKRRHFYVICPLRCFFRINFIWVF